MQNAMPDQDLLREKVSVSLEKNLTILGQLFTYPRNKDIVLRHFRACGITMCLVHVEGISSADDIGFFILQPLLRAAPLPAETLPENYAQQVSQTVLSAAQTEDVDDFETISGKLLAGLSCLFLEGCENALVIETRDPPKRSVSRTLGESVVMGAQEGFVENLRENISLVRKNIKSPMLVTEMFSIGTKIKSQAALIYLRGVADEQVLAEARRRLRSIDRPAVQGTGHIMQLIEDCPMALLPQMLQTERPDRTAAGLLEGQFAILADNSPYALLAPVTVYHFLHASDDTFMRWQYGTFVRLVRMMGIFLSLFLPAIYVALTLYHSQFIPTSLLTAIAETRSNVPLPILVEVVVMELSFYLINEAGTRIPSQIGSALGIVGALILGQAVVSASIISPILIIIIALTGLGNFVVPSYTFGIGLQIYRLGILIFSALFGFYGFLLATFALATGVASLTSFGAPFTAPVAPHRRHNADILVRMPLKMQNRPLFYASKHSWLR